MNPPMNDKTSGTGSGDLAPDGLHAPARHQSLRNWPALLLIALGILARFGTSHLEGGMSSYWMIGLMGPLLCSVLILIWWLTASRATGKERLLGFVTLIASLAVTLWLVDPSMRGPGTIQMTLPMGVSAFAIGVMALGGRRPRVRTTIALLLALAGFGFSLLLRNEGATGEYWLDTHWRWSPSPEERMLAARKPETAPRSERLNSVKDAMAFDKPEWPGFRGADRAARARGPQIATNWTTHPPRQLWKIPVGPAWSSFAIAGRRLFTQEQRGPMETIVCYDAATGREVWKQQVEARFDDPLGGPGPRATPALSTDGLFVTGATGMFLRLNRATGDVVWKQDLQKVSGRKAPMWGFSSSPVVAGSVVIVYAGGPGDKGVLAFDVGSGALRWSASAGNDSYSSPQLNTLAGVDLVLMLSNEGLVFLDPATGQERLNYPWKFSNYRALQPHVVGDDTVLLPTGMSSGTRSIRVTKANDQLAAKELWTSRNLKPDFTDFVSHQGCVYGIDGGILTCVDLKTGERKWKDGRYGKGQVLLLVDSGLLLVTAEQGQVALLQADPTRFTELASIQAIEGKTWNHPVVIGDKLYLRNSQEAACYQLPLAELNQKSEVKQP